MGNWPSVISDDEGSEVGSDRQELDSTDQEDGDDHFCGSEKSFFSEDELLPIVDSDDNDGGHRDRLIHTPEILSVEEDDFSRDEMDRSQYDLAPEYQSEMFDGDVAARYADLPHPQGTNYSSTESDEDDIDDDDDDDQACRRRMDINSVVNEDEDDEAHCSIPLPPPSSPYMCDAASEEHAMESINAHHRDTNAGSPVALEDIVIPVERPVEECSASARVVAWEIDVSDMTAPKKNSRKKMPNKQSKVKARKSSSKSSVEPSYVPPSVCTTPELIAQRKCLDQRRWFCMSRPQYSKSCGISSLVSCWNYLFSTLGGGSMPPITQEEALTVLGFQPPFGEIRFGPFTGNATLMRWFKQLNDHYGVRGRSYYQYKPHGRNRTVGRTSAEGLHLLQQGLKDPNMAFIYHCYNHYFCPIGYEDVPLKAVDAYRDPLHQDEVETWILIGDPSRKHPGIHCFKWEDISTDLNCQSPDYFNIRKRQLGVQQRRTKRTGGNLHCIMAFCRSAGFLTKPTRTKGAVKSRSECGKTSEAQVSGRTVGNSISEETVRLAAAEREVQVGGSTPCLQSGKAYSNDIVKQVAPADDCNGNRSKDPGFLMGVRDRMESKVTATEQITKNPVSNMKDAETIPKDSKTKKKVVRKRKTRKLKSSAKVEEGNDASVERRLQEAADDGTSLYRSEGQRQSPSDNTGLHCQQSVQDSETHTDEVDRFIASVSTHFRLDLSEAEIADVEALKAAMNRSHSALYVDPKKEEDWVLLGQTEDRKQVRLGSSGDNALMGLSDFRGLGLEQDELASADDVMLSEKGRPDGEVSELAKHLIDQYLVSIIDNIDSESINTA